MRVGKDMKNKKGFTLVELLAVIIVLSLILAIAVPSVNKYLKASKEKAYEVQINNMLEAAETYANTYREILPQNDGDETTITLGQLKAEGLIKNEITDPREDKYFDDSLEFVIRKNGKNYVYEVVESSIKTRENKEKSPTLILDGDLVEYYRVGDTYKEAGYSAFDNNGEPINNVMVSEELTMLTTSGIYKLKYTATDKKGVTTTAVRTVIVNYEVYTNGYIVYFNPVTGNTCTTSEVVSSATGTKDGCMKWYAFLDNKSSSTVNLILNHNTTAYVAWNSNYSGTTPDTVNAQLAVDITNWNTNIKSAARLISANEINQIAPTAEGHTWSQTDTSTWYYLHTGLTGSSNKYEGAAGSNTYDWLFDNTYNCTTYGCNTADNGTYGYWTSSFASSGNAWDVNCDGTLRNIDVVDDGILGVRPVITVDKLLLR